MRNKYRGACVDRLRGRYHLRPLGFRNTEPVPDVDNAAVGNMLALLQEDTTNGILLFFIF